MIKNENKSESPIVSVIILTYNQEKYIVQCVNSVIEQVTEYSFEIVISDDKSTDASQKIIRHLEEENKGLIRYNFNENNQGIVKNFLAALEFYAKENICV